MGTPTPEKPIGTYCSLCSPVLWPLDETPEFVEVVFNGMDDCEFPDRPPPPNDTFILAQVVGSPCEYYLETSDMVFKWENAVGQSLLTAQFKGGPSEFYFYSVYAHPCETFFDNQNPLCEIMASIATGGSGFVTPMV